MTDINGKREITDNKKCAKWKMDMIRVFHRQLSYGETCVVLSFCGETTGMTRSADT